MMFWKRGQNLTAYYMGAACGLLVAAGVLFVQWLGPRLWGASGIGMPSWAFVGLMAIVAYLLGLLQLRSHSRRRVPTRPG